MTTLSALSLSDRCQATSNPYGYEAENNLTSTTDANDHTTSFEYGRYNRDFGNVRQMPVPNLVIGSDGKPTQASLDNLYGYISKHYGHDTHVDATYHADADNKKIIRFAKQRMNDKNRKPYDILNNNCKTFARDAVNVGRK